MVRLQRGQLGLRLCLQNCLADIGKVAYEGIRLGLCIPVGNFIAGALKQAWSSLVEKKMVGIT